MFKSLLNATISIDSLILDIFIILGVVIAAALVVYFLWEAVVAISNKNKNAEQTQVKPEPAKDQVVVMNYQIDAPKEEEKVEEAQPEEVDEEKAAEEEATATEEISEEERENAERRAYLEARRQELIRRMQSEMEEESEEEDEEEETEENSEEEAEEETVQAEEVEQTTDSLEEERQALVAEKERYAAMVKELELAKQALADANQQTPVVETVVTNGVLSLEDLKAKLAEAEENLKANDKEFKQCRKEYMPLHRVWTTHERDQRKLRSREAIVAKQKVLLYGVNNMADIDEEKAKKLAEDLDLLDGLKLSVQHCEEVMKESEERYPLLEKMYYVLKQRNDELKNDIAYYKAEIEKLESEAQTETQESAE